MEDDVETRTVLTLRTGTKICVLIGLGLIILAAYFFIVPITAVRTNSGAVFGCGTAVSPSHGTFADGVCGRVADVNRYRAIASLIAGVLTVVVGALMFGVDRREEKRRVPRDYDDYEDRRRDRRRDRFDTDERDRAGRRGSVDERDDETGADDTEERDDPHDAPRRSRRRESRRVRDDRDERYDDDSWGRRPHTADDLDDDTEPAHSPRDEADR